MTISSNATSADLLVLGRQAVVDRCNDTLRACTQISAHAGVRIEAAQNEAAAVKEHEQRKRACAAIRLARLAADLGFDCLWSAEHHFNDYSFVPNNMSRLVPIG